MNSVVMVDGEVSVDCAPIVPGLTVTAAIPFEGRGCPVAAPMGVVLEGQGGSTNAVFSSGSAEYITDDGLMGSCLGHCAAAVGYIAYFVISHYAIRVWQLPLILKYAARFRYRSR